MSTHSLVRGRSLCLLAVLVPYAHAVAGDAWISVGPAMRGGMEAKAKGTSYVQAEGVHAAQPGHSGPRAGATERDEFASASVQQVVRDPAIGDAAALADRAYDDGYVNRDAATGGGGAGSDLTWYWGYDNAGQYDASSGELTFHATRDWQGAEYTFLDAASRTTERNTTLTTLQDDPLDLEDCMSGYGLSVAAGWDAIRRGPWTLSAAGGITALFGAGADMAGRPYAEQVDERTTRVTESWIETRTDRTRRTDAITDTYDTGGIGMPPAGHRGTYLGPFDSPPVIPSPLIPNLPASREESEGDWVPYSSRTTGSAPESEVSRGAASWIAGNRVDFDVDMRLWDVWLGPRFTFSPAKHPVAFFLQPCLSVNAVDVSVDRAETFTAQYADGSTAEIQRWTDRDDATKVRLGAGMAVGGRWELDNGLFALLQGGYDWVDDVEVRSGPDRVSIDPSGYFAGLALGWRFGAGRPSPEPAAAPAEGRAP